MDGLLSLRHSTGLGNPYFRVLIWVHMTSKNISITEEVYRLLSHARLEGESFSDAIRRLVKRSSLSGSAGLWSNLSKEELALLDENIGSLRARARQSLDGKRP